MPWLDSRLLFVTVVSLVLDVVGGFEVTYHMLAMF